MLENTNRMNEVDNDGFLKISLVNQGMLARKHRVCPLKDIPDEEINYKNIKLLNKYIYDILYVHEKKVKSFLQGHYRKVEFYFFYL